MAHINIIYRGELRCEAAHEDSGTVLVTDAPKDNHGQGESFSPTDLVATALGTCMLTLMGIAARTLQVDLTGTKISVRKEMTAKPIRRIGALTVMIEVPVSVDETQKQKLIDAAMTCPVHKSLHQEIDIQANFYWGNH